MTNEDKIVEYIKNNGADIGIEMGFTKLTPLHSEWISQAVFATKDWKIYAHRGSYKSTAVDIVGIALKMILFPNMNGRFFRKTDDKVKEVIRGISSALKSDIAKWISKELWGTPVMLTVDNTMGLSTNLYCKPGGAMQLTGHGFKTPITSAHADWILTDDISDLSDKLFKKERENTKTMYQELRNIINRDPWCCIGNTGTSWAKDDVEILMPEGKKITCYDSGLLTSDEITELKTQMTPQLFAANYELRHISGDQQLFSEPQMIDSLDQLYDGVGHLDAAYGGGDTTALTILNKRPDNSLVGYGKVYDKSVMLCINDIAEVFRKYRVKTIYCESNADKGYLARDLGNMGFNVISYHESQNKGSKIGTYGLKAWRKTKWVNETDINYLGQIVDYQEGVGLDDCPDSYSSLCRQIESGQAERIWI